MIERRIVLGICALLAMRLPVAAHDSPSDVILRLSEQIRAQGASMRLLTARGFEHCSLGHWEAAIADFTAALELEPANAAARLGCIEALLHEGSLAAAEALARRGLELVADATSQARFHALLARIYTHHERWLEALVAWRGALRSPHPEIDWFLGEAACLERLSRDKERCEALARAMRRNPSVVLHRAWVRALVEAGALEQASREIERGIANARWKSAWLLLRARVRGQREDYDGQKADAVAALVEIRRRLHPDRPDPALLAEEAEARRVLGG